MEPGFWSGVYDQREAGLVSSRWREGLTSRQGVRLDDCRLWLATS